MLIDRALVLFTTFRYRVMLYRNRKALKGRVTVYLDLTKARLDLLIKARNYIKKTFNADFAYSDVNKFFDSMENLISKIV